jgi:hypothetical protein
MCGLLIYTASGNSEGTMGGLIRQGRPERLEATLRRAMSHASWCSVDPVCIESTDKGRITRTELRAALLVIA